MKQFIRNTIAFAGQAVPFKLLRAGQTYPPFLPFYHIVNNAQPDYITSYAVRTPQQFEAELNYLLKYFKPVGLKEILQSPAKNKMHLSFDDGLKECYSVIAPLLKKKGIPATFFVSPDFVDNKNLFHRFKRGILESKGILKPGKKKYFIQEAQVLDQLAIKYGIDFSAWQPYMGFEEIINLHNDGFTIGAHSLNHPEMWTLTEAEQYRQIEQSMQWVTSYFHPEIKAFAFPFTDNGLKQSLFDRIKKNGLVDVTFGTAGLKYDSHPINLQRVPVELKQNWPVRKVVHFEYFYFTIRKLLGVNIVKH